MSSILRTSLLGAAVLAVWALQAPAEAADLVVGQHVTVAAAGALAEAVPAFHHGHYRGGYYGGRGWGYASVRPSIYVGAGYGYRGRGNYGNYYRPNAYRGYGYGVGYASYGYASPYYRPYSYGYGGYGYPRSVGGIGYGGVRVGYYGGGYGGGYGYSSYGYVNRPVYSYPMTYSNYGYSSPGYSYAGYGYPYSVGCAF